MVTLIDDHSVVLLPACNPVPRHFGSSGKSFLSSRPSTYFKWIERETSASSVEIAPKGPVPCVYKSAFDKYIDHVFVASNIDLLKCKCYNKILLNSGRPCLFHNAKLICVLYIVGKIPLMS